MQEQDITCPNCGNPGKPNEFLVKLGTTPENRSKYEVSFITFSAMFLLGIVLFCAGLMMDGAVKLVMGLLLGLVGAIGILISTVGYWLVEPRSRK